MSEQSQTSSTPEQTQQQQRNIPVVRVQVDGNSVIPLLRAFASKAYANNVFSLAEAAKLHEVFQFIDNLSLQAQQQQESNQLKSDINSLGNTVNSVTGAVEEPLTKASSA